MSYTIVMSGVGGFAKQAARALTDAGLLVHDEPISHQLPDKVTGGVDPTVDFVTCEGDDVDAAAGAVAPLGWVLRSHFPTPPIPPESPEEVLRRIVREELAAARSEV